MPPRKRKQHQQHQHSDDSDSEHSTYSDAQVGASPPNHSNRRSNVVRTSSAAAHDKDQQQPDSTLALLPRHSDRLALRKSIRSITTEIESNLSLNSSLPEATTATLTLLSSSNSLFQRVKHVREALDDADNLNRLSEFGQRHAKQINQRKDITIQDFIKVFKRKFKKRSEEEEERENQQDGDEDDEKEPETAFVMDAEKLEEFARPFGRGVHIYAPCLLPSLLTSPSALHPSSTTVIRSAPVRRQKEDMSQVTEEQPTTLTVEGVAAEERSATDYRLQHVIDALPANGEPVFLYEFALDPHSYVHTVENIFDLSFLVKSSSVKMFVDEVDGLPYVARVIDSADDDLIVEGGNKAILSINYKKWKEGCEKLGLKQAYINRHPIITTTQQQTNNGTLSNIRRQATIEETLTAATPNKSNNKRRRTETP